ncbi:hypothetical protein GUITHDRAFT_108386 [Guillardia theta CCMP2712]|uniref:Plastid lipid-associated protein/fibrillin conserved domain-containing protein n=1 Tax=Guillardia theta (strain CCMP2712) TaxID=905079 RepID=L1JCV5_GUITC|nr:hypothetical protein GUITHDRAFT_108386 [Guillardia theta CCMP2712]EKX45935.1 hypothetical protein GUITHDRAFT_108386 [Guillardia theta CCMP2712]|eukprot:XP_005832915.1 hypothetical protein GUITHDRAFT_108386 [Guillardia theta CCMP2712]
MFLPCCIIHVSAYTKPASVGDIQAMAKKYVFFLLHLYVATVESFASSSYSNVLKGRSSRKAACYAVNPFDLQKSFSALLGNFASVPEKQLPVKVSRKEELKAELRAICQRARKGLSELTTEDSQRMQEIMAKLESKFSIEKPAESLFMQGRWNMLWTTEKEILFLVEKGLFGLQCTGVWQDINLQEASLTNIIDFEMGKGMLK